MGLRFRICKSCGYILGGPCNEDYIIWGSILGSPILGSYHVGFI